MEEKTREDAWATMAEVAQVRYTVDTRDSFYEGEVQFWNETIPAIHLLIQKGREGDSGVSVYQRVCRGVRGISL